MPSYLQPMDDQLSEDDLPHQTDAIASFLAEKPRGCVPITRSGGEWLIGYHYARRAVAPQNLEAALNEIADTLADGEKAIILREAPSEGEAGYTLAVLRLDMSS